MSTLAGVGDDEKYGVWTVFDEIRDDIWNNTAEIKSMVWFFHSKLISR